MFANVSMRPPVSLGPSFSSPFSSAVYSSVVSSSRGSRVWVKNPLACFTANDLDASGGIVIENGLIEEVLAAGDVPSLPVDEVFDARDLVVLPGLINTHHHFYQTLTRAWAPVVNVPSFSWLKTLSPVWARLTPDALSLATQVAMVELLLSGCTTTADHHYLFPTGMENAIDVQVDVVRQLGMRAMLTRGSMSFGADEGGLPQYMVQDGDTILADSQRLIHQYHERGSGAQVQIALAPYSPFSVTREIMLDSSKLAEQEDVRLHTHLEETLDEEAFCLKMFGLSTLDYLESVGWLSDRTWLAHGVHFNKDEIQRLGAAGTGICHCPVSNMRLASGICPTLDLIDAGVPIGLGVDGSASNNASNMMYEARQALYLQRLEYGAQKVTPEKVLGWATKGSAQLLGRQDIGEIAVGKQADLAFYKQNELRFSRSHDPIVALLLCGSVRAEHVMVGGQWRVKDRQILGVDLEVLIAKHKASAKKLIAGI